MLVCEKRNKIIVIIIRHLFDFNIQYSINNNNTTEKMKKSTAQSTQHGMEREREGERACVCVNRKQDQNDNVCFNILMMIMKE